MAYRVYQSVLAPKCTIEDNIDLSNKSHMIMWSRCNFRCKFCEQASENFQNTDEYSNLSEDQFISVVMHLIQHSKNFKFSGGEPTLNPRLEWDLSVVKSFGGTVFLDTNGSNYSVIKGLLDKKLIDVLAVSLKGLSPEECSNVSGIKKQELCWENVFKTIKHGSECENVKVIVTHVCYNDADIEELNRFSDLLKPYKNVFYKINNLHKDKHLDPSVQRVDKDKLFSLIKNFLKDNPYWKNRIIYVDDDEGITEYDKIVFL